MYLYLLYLISPVLIAPIINVIKGRKQNLLKNNSFLYLVIMTLLMCFFLGFRSQYIGSGDAVYYYSQWESISKITNFRDIFSYDMEYGYLVFVYLFSRLFKSGQYVFVFSGIGISLLTSFFIKNFCKKDYSYAFLIINSLGLFAFFLQGIRQSIAIALCLASLVFCKKKKVLPFILVIFFATSFHASAIVFVLSYFLFGRKLNFKFLSFFFLIAIISIVTFDRLMDFANLIINDDYNFGNTEQTTGGIVTLVIYLTVVLICFVFKLSENDEEFIDFSFYFYMTLIGILLFILRYFASTIIERMSFYYIFGIIPLLESVIYSDKRINRNDRKILYVFTLILFFSFAVYKGLTGDSFIPFKFFWE